MWIYTFFLANSFSILVADVVAAVGIFALNFYPPISNSLYSVFNHIRYIVLKHTLNSLRSVANVIQVSVCVASFLVCIVFACLYRIICVYVFCLFYFFNSFVYSSFPSFSLLLFCVLYVCVFISSVFLTTVASAKLVTFNIASKNSKLRGSPHLYKHKYHFPYTHTQYQKSEEEKKETTQNNTIQ